MDSRNIFGQSINYDTKTHYTNLISKKIIR